MPKFQRIEQEFIKSSREQAIRDCLNISNVKNVNKQVIIVDAHEDALFPDFR